MKSIFVGSEKKINKVYTDEIKARLEKEAGLDAKTVYSDISDFEKDPSCADADYIFSTWGMLAPGECEIKKYLPKLKGVFYAAGSVQKFARPFLNLGIPVYSAWAANAIPVAEYTEALILLANKGFFGSCRLASAGLDGYRLAAKTLKPVFPGNYDCRVGIIGAGMIGSMVAERMSKHNVKVLICDPFCSDEKIASLGAERASLEEIFSTCQTVTNHTANNPETVGMLNYSLFSKMPRNATFINTGRGAQVVEDDLIRALEEDPSRSAVLDVTNPEPPEENGKFYSMPNVYLTPHIAGSTGNEVARMAEYMYEEFLRVKNGTGARYGVTLKMLETMA